MPNTILNLRVMSCAGGPSIENERAWPTEEIPDEPAIHSFDIARPLEATANPTGAISTDILRFMKIARRRSCIRYKAGDTALGDIVALKATGSLLRDQLRVGAVYRVAFGVPANVAQVQMAKRLLCQDGARTAEQKNCDCFQAVHCREPNAIILETAIDAAGFAVDERAQSVAQAVNHPRSLQAGSTYKGCPTGGCLNSLGSSHPGGSWSGASFPELYTLKRPSREPL